MKKKKKIFKQKIPLQTPFEIYKQSLSETEQAELALFFDDMSNHVMLAKKENLKIQADFENALLYYSSIGLPLDEALKRLSVANLGGFYARPPVLWYPLDDAAKIYPLSIQHGQMAVFRLSIYFKQDIVPEILQMALTFTIKRFPSFATTVKKGVFWHYLDTSKRKYNIELESDIPCRPLLISRSGSQSFRVVYYQNRLSIEYFHILTDGTGGMVFLKTLTAEYLRLLGTKHNGAADGILNINDIPTKGETVNEFLRAEKTKEISGYMDKPALQMSGKISRIKPCRVLHFKMNAAILKDVAKSKKATITAYILALMFIACKSATDASNGDINIQVPVNMRKFYPSETVRNFSMFCSIRLPIDSITNKESIIEEISEQLIQKSSQDNMRQMLNSTGRMVRLLRYVPLFIKTPVARKLNGYVADMVYTNNLSNLGVVKMPPEMAEQIDCMDFVLGTSPIRRASCALITFENTTVFSISKMTTDPSFEEKLYSLFVEDGIIPLVEGSELYEN